MICTPLSQSDVPESPASASAGCRLVAKLNFRRSESRRLVTLEDGEYAANPGITVAFLEDRCPYL
jgi:hypothetical protein